MYITPPFNFSLVEFEGGELNLNFEKMAVINIKKYGKPPRILIDKQTARNYYYLIYQFLDDNTAYENIDKYIIAMAANSLTIYGEAIRDVEVNGTIQTFATGAKNVSAYYTVMRDSIKTFTELSDKIGLDAKAREKLKAFADKADANDPLSNFMKKVE